MNNKIIFARIAFCLLTVATWWGCSDDEDFKEVQVTAVNTLYTPPADRAVTLVASETASVYFEWEKAIAQDNGLVYYDVLFDVENGDFSNPLYIATSDNKGLSTGATITHKVLNKIAGFAGIESGTAGTVKWTIMASRGLTKTMAKDSRKLTITRLSGFDAPPALYITGEGTEGGDDFTKAQVFSSPAQGEFEIFTKLTAGKSYKFTDNKDESIANLFHISNNQLKEGDSFVSTVTETGVYCIKLDFTLGAVSFYQVKKMGLFFCPSNNVTIDLPYVAAGQWAGEGYVEFRQESWGRDERYKFQMEIVENGADKIVQWGPTTGGLDSRPTGAADYFNMKINYNVDQWGEKWKFAEEMDYANVRIDVYLQGDKTYYHKVTKK